jgi:hypothetical protein
MHMDVVAAICLIAAASIAAFLIGRLQGQKEGFEAGVGFMMNMMNGIEIESAEEGEEGE